MPLTGLSSQPEVAAGDDPGRLEHVLRQSKLQRLLAFAGHDIDDVVNSPVAKREVARYFKVGRAIDRRSEVVELERQWNPLG